MAEASALIAAVKRARAGEWGQLTGQKAALNGTAGMSRRAVDESRGRCVRCSAALTKAAGALVGG